MSRDLYCHYNYQELGQLDSTYSLFLDTLVDLVSAQFTNPSILDVGAGGGYTAQYLLTQGCQVTALDPSPESMSATTARLIREPFENMSTNQKFSAVHQKDVVGTHITPTKFLSKSAEVITDGGLVMTCALILIADQLSAAARSMGFHQINEFTWTPPDPRKDWYIVGNKTRMVTIYQKS